MCKSVEEGGKRCPGIAATRYARAWAKVEAALDSPGASLKLIAQAEASASPDASDVKSVKDGSCRAPQETVTESVIAYARHKSGKVAIAKQVKILRMLANYAETPGEQMRYEQAIGWLNKCVEEADKKEEVERDVRKQKAAASNKNRDASRKNARIDAERAARMAKRVKAEDSLGAAFPYIRDMWDTEANGGLTPDQVPRGSSRIMLQLVCPEVPTHKWEVRGDYPANSARSGRIARCPWCSRTGFAKLQENLTALAEAAGVDPSVLDKLSPATRLRLAKELGLIKPGENSISNSVIMSAIHGNVSISEIMGASVVEDLKGVTDSLGDTEAIIAETTDLVDFEDLALEDESTVGSVAEIMDTAKVATLVADNEALAQQIVDESVNKLWDKALSDPDSLDAIKEELNALDSTDPYQQLVRDRFLDQLTKAENTELPEGFQSVRTIELEDGTTRVVTIDPMLSQRRFMVAAQEQSRIGNWSGTGAGKTLSTVLATRANGAMDTIVVSPLTVREHWEDEYVGAYPDTEIRYGLPEVGETVGDPSRPRVWLVNYEQLSTDDAALRLGALEDRVDAVVLDEVHNLKITGSNENQASKRRKAFEDFLGNAAEARVKRSDKDLSVIGLSATPVVNDLSEARSVMRLITGKPQYSRVEPTYDNIAAMHHRMMNLGIRWKPSHSQSLKRSDRMVDITADSEDIIRSIADMRAASGSRVVTASMVERALLPYKMPAIVDSVRSAQGKPVIVYSHYVDGMVDPIVERLSQETKPDGSRMRVARFTGKEKEQERNRIIADFRAGKIDVIVGSDPIATGVDGLQDVCGHAVVASMPWTAALDEQFAGRLYRKGMQGDVTIDYVLTEAKGSKRWSWCLGRKNAVHNKRSLADGVMDGIMPDSIVNATKGANSKAISDLLKLSDMIVIDGEG